MDSNIRNDQIWIIDKTKNLNTTATSVFDFVLTTSKKITKQYLKNRFGGTPIIEDKLGDSLF
jgi:hypothetical protein